MTSRPPCRALTARVSLILLLPLLSVGCGDGGKSAEPGITGGSSSEETAEAREKKARALLERGRAAPPLEKVRIFGTLVGRFPETTVVPEAYMRLVRILVDRDLDRPEEAFKQTRAFAARRPETTLWTECFRWLHVSVRNPVRGWDPALKDRIDRAFLECVDGALASGRFAGSGDDEAILRLERARVLAATGKRRESIREFERAAAVLPIENQRVAMRILVEMGELQAEFPDRRSQAARAFARAIELSRTYKRSYSTDGLLRRVEQLGLVLPPTPPAKDG